MQLSIRVRTILALNVFVLGLALVLGWIAQDVAGQIVEERFAKEMAAGVARLFKTKEYPLNDTMMTYLREMFHAEWLASRETVTRIVASSLPPQTTRQFQRQISHMEKPGVIQLDGQTYRLDWADVPVQNPPEGQSVSCRLFMLVPNEQFQQARAKASAQVLKTMLPSAAVATILAILLAFTITRPLRKLAGEMDRLATDESGTEAPRAGSVTKGPREIVRLAASFHQLLDRLAAARSRLAQTERLATLGKVSLSVAHELRNPLSGIKMHARLLKDSVDKSSSESLDVMLREIERMELYLDELMSLSVGGDVEKRSLNLAPARLSEIADGVLTILAGRCRHAKIEIVKEFSPDEPLPRVDANQLRQVMMNLMVNAIQAMPTGGTMTVRVAQPPPAVFRVAQPPPAVSSVAQPPPAVFPEAAMHPQSVIFQVADTGKGVTIRDRDIFEAFVSDKPNGVGLGLYLCKQIVTRHGGNIGYDSSDSGATFWFSVAWASCP